MSNRFHNKFHRQNHHSRRTTKNQSYTDAAYDPIASFEVPFQGEFYSEGNIITTQNLSATNNLTIGGSFTVNGPATVGIISTGATNSVITENSGLLQKRTTNSSIWDTTAKFVSASDGALTVNRLTKATNAAGINESIVFDDGINVGVGTDTPGSKLTVNGTLSSSGTATFGTIPTNSTGTSFVVETNGLLQKRIVNFASVDTSGVYVSASDGALSVNYLTKATNSNGINESIVFDDGINVGIGETSPEGKLHVKSGSAGSVTAQPNSIGVFENSSNAYVSILSPNAQYAGVVMGGPGNPYGSYVSWNHDNSALKVATAHSQGSIQFLVNTEQEAVRILSGGNVGIGIVSPSEKLDVNGNIQSNALIIPGSSTVTPSAITILPADNDVIFNNQTGTVTLTGFSNGKAGVTYTLTNKSANQVSIETSSNLFVRGTPIVLAQNYSCSLRMDSATSGSVW